MAILLYSKTTCRWCLEVKAFLRQHHIPFEVKEKDLDPQAYEELVQRTGQDMTPTLVFENGDLLTDSDRDEVERYLREHGMLSD